MTPLGALILLVIIVTGIRIFATAMQQRYGRADVTGRLLTKEEREQVRRSVPRLPHADEVGPGYRGQVRARATIAPARMQPGTTPEAPRK